MTKQEAQELMTYLEMGWSIPDCKLFVELRGKDTEVEWNPRDMELQWDDIGAESGYRALGIGWVLENPENYSWKKIRGGWEFEWNGRSKCFGEREPKTERFFWRKLCDFSIGKN